jgi:hypothetical protein
LQYGDLYALNPAAVDISKHTELVSGFEDWYQAFWELSTDRRFGDGAVGPIPASSIARHTAGWPPEEIDIFRAVIRAMDRIFISGDLTEPRETDAETLRREARDSFRASFRAKGQP